MKIGLYIEHGSGGGVGGAELMMAAVAAEWSKRHAVDFIHHRPALIRDRIASFSGDDYRRVHFRYVAREPDPELPHNPFRRYSDARCWHARISAGYDLFVNCTHWLPCFSHARHSILLVLFPFYIRPPDTSEMKQLPLWKRARHHAYFAFEWRKRLKSYQHCFAISEFSREWTRRRWRCNCAVLHPPVDLDFTLVDKEPMILSVGRFSTMAHTKKQLEMMQVFSDIAASIPGWSYTSAGGLNSRSENYRYFDAVRMLAPVHSATVEANLSRRRIRGLFERASIFWHATGWNDDTNLHPELCEHFGISTVEAMAAGCVPVVINKGGQAEIVEHGRSGFLWETRAELEHYTQLLVNDRALRDRMAEAARIRSAAFSRAIFLGRLSAAGGVGGANSRGNNAAMRA